MTEFIATIYEWFGYSNDLGEHLRGMDITCSSFIGTDFYLQIFLIMLAVNILSFIIMYLVIDKFTARFSTSKAWWLIAALGMLINFGIAVSLPNTVDVCEQLHINSTDLMLYATGNAIWSLITFALITSFPFPRNFSNNSRLTTFWKP